MDTLEMTRFHLPLCSGPGGRAMPARCGAYMSAAETAITGASPPRMHRLAQQGNKRAAMVNRLLERKDEAVSAVLLGNSVINILSASLTTAVLTVVFGAAGVVYATMIVGILVVFRRGDAQDLGAAARRPRGLGAGALDPVQPDAARPAGARRRLDLAGLPPPVA